MIEVPEGFRSGFACFVGRPNAGKSTLMNALVGTKVAITADQPQTTRRAIRGIVHRPEAQLVIVDTPGLHRPRTLLGERLNDVVRETLSEVDVIGFCLPANEKTGPGDQWIARELATLRAPVIAIVTKMDLVPHAALAERLMAVTALGDWADIVPVSARSGEQVDVLADVHRRATARGAADVPGRATSRTSPQAIMIAELVREAALEGVRDELPHSLAVMVEEITQRESVRGAPPVADVSVAIYVERDSQKGIVIGHQGARLKDVGTRARAGIEALMGQRVYLDIRVKIAKDWQRDPKQLGRLGF